MNRQGAWVLVSLMALMLGCATPGSELWPPRPGDASHTVLVSLDTWHAMIAFPRTTSQSLVLSPESSDPTSQSSVLNPQSHVYEEWGYAEQGWYIENRQGVSGVLRSLFWPSPGVVEVGHHSEIWSERTPQPPADRFTFRLSEKGYLRLQRYLRAAIADTKPLLTAEESTFYLATSSYHLFHHCHHYTARALREAGLPISVFWAFNRGSFSLQLQRAERMAAEEGLLRG